MLSIRRCIIDLRSFFGKVKPISSVFSYLYSSILSSFSCFLMSTLVLFCLSWVAIYSHFRCENAVNYLQQSCQICLLSLPTSLRQYSLISADYPASPLPHKYCVCPLKLSLATAPSSADWKFYCLCCCCVIVRILLPPPLPHIFQLFVIHVVA